MIAEANFKNLRNNSQKWFQRYPEYFMLTNYEVPIITSDDRAAF